VVVIEWAERLEDGILKNVKIEIISESERKITYDDPGA